MKTKQKLASTLIDLMQTKPIDEISVLSITSACKVNRQTFYYHFLNIYDLLTYIFLNEKIEGVNNAKSNLEALEIVLEYVSNNYNLFKNTSLSAGKDLLIEFFFNIFYNVSIKSLNNVYLNKRLIDEDIKFIARFLGSGYSNIITNYINSEEEDYSSLLKKAKDFFSKYEAVSLGVYRSL